MSSPLPPSPSSGRFDGRLVLVTGGRSGIGLGCAERFAAEGAEVVALDISDPSAPVDVTDEEGVDAFVAGLDRAPDVLVCAAGVGHAMRLVDMPFTEWRRVLSINLDGTFLALRAVARRMLADGTAGSIINIASINQEWAMQGFGPYCASKAGVAMLTKVAALELAPHGIRVNAIAPGPIETPLLRTAFPIPGLEDELCRRTPFEQRLGTTGDIAGVAAFLASDDGRWIIGRSIVVDGGHSLVGEPDFIRMLETGRA